MPLQIAAIIGPGIAGVAFILFCVGTAMPLISLESGSTKAWYTPFETCAEISSVKICSSADSGCAQFDSTRKAAAAFDILSCLFGFAAAAYGCVRAIVPAFNDGTKRMLFVVLCGVVAVLSLIAGAIGVSTFTTKYCDSTKSVSDQPGASIGANGILQFVGMALIIGAAIIDLMMNKGASAAATSTSGTESGKANSNVAMMLL